MWITPKPNLLNNTNPQSVSNIFNLFHFCYLNSTSYTQFNKLQNGIIKQKTEIKYIHYEQSWIFVKFKMHQLNFLRFRPF